MRLAFFLLTLAASFFVSSLPALSLLTGYLLFYSWASRLPLAGLRRLAPFLALVLVLNLVFPGGRSLVEALLRAGVYMARILAMYLATVSFVSSTAPEDGARAVAAVLRPFGSRLSSSAAFYSFLALGLFPLMRDETARVARVQRFRGGGLGGGLLGKALGARTILVPLFLSTLRRSAQLAVATSLKGVRDKMTFEVHLENPPAWDYLWLAGALAVAALVPLVF